MTILWWVSDLVSSALPPLGPSLTLKFRSVTHLPSPATATSATQSPASILLSHLSDLYPTEPQTTFSLDHKLFVSTASLLPNSDSKRAYTHLFTSSHAPQKSFIGTTTPQSSPNDFQIITVPTTPSLEAFTSLLHQKLQPQWAPRQFVILEHGGSATVPLADGARWQLSVGDLKTVTNASRGAANTTGGQNRGLVIEVQYDSDDVENESKSLSAEDTIKYELLFKALLKGLFRKLTGKLDLKLDDAKMHMIRLNTTEDHDEKESTIKAHTNEKSTQQTTGKPAGSQVAELYMELLRGSRG